MKFSKNIIAAAALIAVATFSFVEASSYLARAKQAAADAAAKAKNAAQNAYYSAKENAGMMKANIQDTLQRVKNHLKEQAQYTREQLIQKATRLGKKIYYAPDDLATAYKQWKYAPSAKQLELEALISRIEESMAQQLGLTIDQFYDKYELVY